MRGIEGLVSVVVYDPHPTIESICDGCGMKGTIYCDGENCKRFLNPAGQ